MEKCPKCGEWSFSINTAHKQLECRIVACGYTQSVDVEKYLEEHSDLPKLSIKPTYDEFRNCLWECSHIYSRCVEIAKDGDCPKRNSSNNSKETTKP